MKFDLCIIGAGPIGICCAIEAKKNNLSYVIIDKGCLVNSLYNYPKNMTFFSTSDNFNVFVFILFKVIYLIPKTIKPINLIN